MLKIYNVKSFYQIDRQQWEECGHIGWTCQDETQIEEEIVILNEVPFYHAFDTIEADPGSFDGLYIGQTMFRRRPYIKIGGAFVSDYTRYFSQNAHTISYKVVYLEKKNITLEWIMKHLSADKAIQYFKDRGINICPIQIP